MTDAPDAAARTAPQSAAAALTKPKKDLSIQSLRGLAVILMVAGHVIGSSTARGLHVPEDSWWRYYYLGLEDIRMPLFTVISGYVYALRPLRSRQDYPSLVRAKSRRLLFPLVTVGTFFFLTKLVVPDTNVAPKASDFWRTYVFGFEHLWFLQAIFLIFLLCGVLDFTGAMATQGRWQVTLGVTLVVFVVLRVPSAFDVFSLNGALRLLPFFLLGYGMRRYGVLDLRGRAALLAGLVLLGALAVKTPVILDDWSVSRPVDRAISLAVGLGGVVLLYSGRRLIRWRWLAWVGGFSFGIYLLHVFGSAAARLLLVHVGVDSIAVQFLVSMVVAISAPIAFQILFRRSKIVQVYILGEKAPTPTPRPAHRVQQARPGAGRDSSGRT